VRTQPHQVIQNTGDFVEHDADILSAQRHFDTGQLFDRLHISVLVAHHGHIVQTVHVGHGLQESLMFSQLFSRTVQKPDVRVCALYHFTIQLQNQTQHTVRGRMLRPKIHCVIFYFRHNNLATQ
jgi:hypothetical protein